MPLIILIISNYYLVTTLFLGLIIIFLNADSLILSLWATTDGDIDETDEAGVGGFLNGIGGFKIVEVAKLLKILEILIISVLG